MIKFDLTPLTKQLDQINDSLNGLDRRLTYQEQNRAKDLSHTDTMKKENQEINERQDEQILQNLNDVKSLRDQMQEVRRTLGGYANDK